MDADRVFLSAEWRHLVMLNYEVNASLLLPFVPVGTELDAFEGRVFASLVGFRFLKTNLLGYLPVPLHSNFDEVNLRFYVRREVGGEIRRGVVFRSEIVPRRAIAFVARTLYNEKYVALPMGHAIHPLPEGGLHVAYRWRSQDRWNEIVLETGGDPNLPAERSVEQFITEHYWGYAAQPGGDTVEYRVAHPPWKVWRARTAAFAGDGEKLYGKEMAALLAREPHSAFLAEGSAVTVMRGRRL